MTTTFACFAGFPGHLIILLERRVSVFARSAVLASPTRRASLGDRASRTTVTNHGRGAAVAAQGQRRWPQHRAHRGRIGDDWWHQGCRARSHRAPSILSAAPGPRQGLRRRLSHPVSRGHRRPNQAHAHALAGLSAWSKFPKLHRPRTAPEGPPALPPVQAARPLRARCSSAR